MRDLEEAVQYIGHSHEVGPNGIRYTFVAIDPFKTHQFTLDGQSDWPYHAPQHSEMTAYPGNNEVQLQRINDLMDPRHDSAWRHANLSPFLKHQNPQFLIQKDTVTLNVVDKNKVVEQFYYMTNDNQFMLVYPNYENLEQKNQVIFQIAQKHSYNISDDIDYQYMDDFLARKKDYETTKYKKIAHVCHEDYRSKNHMKRSEHLRMIIDYRAPFEMNHRLILSTDQERSNIYVYQSNVISGHNEIEIYNYENNIDHAVSLIGKAAK